METQPLQTFANQDDIEALLRVEAALGITSGPGRRSPTGLKNVKRSLRLSIRIADWILATGMQPPANVTNGDAS